MFFRKCFILFLIFLFWLCWLPSDPSAEIKTEPKTNDLKSQVFTHIAAGVSTVQTISSDFSQERHLSMMKEPLISTGKFAYEKPDHIYWEIVKPSPAGFVVQGDKAKRWGSDPRISETVEIDQVPMVRAIVDQVLAWTRADFPRLEKRYRIMVTEETPYLLKLIPLSSQEKRFLTHITITFSEDWTYVRYVELHEKGGDFTRIRFLKPLLNSSLPKDLFEK